MAAPAAVSPLHLVARLHLVRPPLPLERVIHPGLIAVAARAQTSEEHLSPRCTRAGREGIACVRRLGGPQ